MSHPARCQRRSARAILGREEIRDAPMTLSDSPARARFAELVARPVIPLAEAALAVAAEEYPGLDAAGHLATLDALAAAVSGRLPRPHTTADTLRALRAVLFEEAGFRGNAESYYDPRNSFLNEVLERKLGIPITLSIVYIEVARRAGLAVEGVGFPGHFLVRCDVGQRPVFIDPFHGGEVLPADDCLARLRGRGLEVDPRHLEPVGPRAILSRLLHNLKRIYVEASDDVRALWVVDRLLLLSPDDAAERRDHGLVCARLGNVAAARRDLEAYLAAAPAADDRAEIEDLLRHIGARTSWLN
jgi:regulator of sirC expression with transglutaminase-like and TPR domain